MLFVLLSFGPNGPQLVFDKTLHGSLLGEALGCAETGDAGGKRQNASNAAKNANIEGGGDDAGQQAETTGEESWESDFSTHCVSIGRSSGNSRGS